jgi:hypothetical protein
LGSAEIGVQSDAQIAEEFAAVGKAIQEAAGPAATFAEQAGIDAGDLLLFAHDQDSRYWAGALRAVERATVQVPKTDVRRDRSGAGQGEGERPKRPRGRKHDTDPKADKRIFDAWQSGSHQTYAELAGTLGMREREVKLAIDRHRKRQAPEQ